MKRLLTVLLLLALAVPAIALADSDEWTAYTHPDDGYQISYPSDWTMADKDTIEKILDDATAEGIRGMDTSVLESSRDSILNDGLTLFIAPGNGLNFNIQYQDMGQEFSAQQLVEAVCPSIIEHFQSMFSDMEVLVPGDVMIAGDVEYAYVFIRLQTNGEQTLLSQTYTMRGTELYIITYTLFPERGLDVEAADALTYQIAASFK